MLILIKAVSYTVKSSEWFSLSFVWLILSTQMEAGFLGCCHFKSCTDPICCYMHAFFLNCLVHVRQNWLRLCEYSPRWAFWHNFVCIWPYKLRKRTEFGIMCCPRDGFLCAWVLHLLHLITFKACHTSSLRLDPKLGLSVLFWSIKIMQLSQAIAICI